MELYEYQTMRSVEDTYWWYTGLRTLVLQRLQQLLKNVSHPKVLDAGCGTGGMMEVIKGKFPEAELTGIDFEPTAVELTNQRNVGTAMKASVERLPFPDEAFDLVLSLDVICSRGVSDQESSREFYRVLKPGGSLLLNLAAFDFLRGQHDLAGHAERRYTKQQVRKLLSAAGFTVERLTYWNMTLFPVLAVWRPLSLIFADKQAPRSDLKPLPDPINRVLTWLILKEIQAMFHRSLPFGSSVFAVASKA
jgi:ubiquinone/menaquinone biosynthesis C-methylase UbiE